MIDGLLTVADDLLKNDGRRFLEMMERLANHQLTLGEPDDGYDDEEDDEDEAYSDDDQYSDEDEPYSDEENDMDGDDDDSVTSFERFEEGRRMFQIIAAKLFEQRVLQAYREKVNKSCLTFLSFFYRWRLKIKNGCFEN